MTTIAEPRAASDLLPPGWRWARLGDVCDIVIGRTPRRDTPEFWNGTLPWVAISDLNGGELAATRERITPAGARESGVRLVPAGTLLFSFKLSIGKMAIAGMDLYTNEAIAAVLPMDALDRDYLQLALSGIDAGADSSHAVKGKTLNQDSLRALTIPLPPLAEQQRIAAILSEQMEAVERARRAVEAQLEAARALPAAYLREVFESDEAKSWPRVRLGEVLAKPLKTGISKPGSPNSTNRCLTLSAVRRGILDLAAAKPTDVTDEEARENRVEPGAFYVMRGNGSRSIVGRGALAPSQIDEPVLYPDLLIRVATDPTTILSDYLQLVWDSPTVRRDIEDRCRTTAGIFKINQANLAEVMLPIPSLMRQERVAEMASKATGSQNRLIGLLSAQQEAVELLPAALLRRAFSGEL